MRNFKFNEIVLVAIVLFAILFFPLVMGHWVERNYRQFIAFYNTQGKFNITIQSYKKEWKGAHVRLAVEALNFPKPLHFIIDQDIQYGPVILPRNPEQAHVLEMAFIHSQIYLTPDTAKIIQAMDPKETLLQLNDAVSFSGKHRIHFHSRGLEINFDDSKREMELDNLVGTLAVTPDLHKIKGNIKADSISVKTPLLSLRINDLDTGFNQYLTDKGLWLGDSRISVSSFNMLDTKGRTLAITNLKTAGNLQGTDTVLNIERIINLDKLQIEDQAIGPLDLHFSAHDLDAAALARLVSAYSESLNPDSENDFLQLTLILLPQVISADSTVKLENLKIDTEDGNLLANGEMNWTSKQLTSRHNLKEIFRSADAQANVRISVILAQDLIQAAADLSYFEKRMMDPQSAYLESKANLGILQKQSALTVAVLTQANQLSREEGKKLLDLQKAKISVDDYRAELNRLLIDKQIPKSTVDILSAQYDKVLFASMTIEEKFEFLEEQFHAKFDEWLKNGYITQDKDAYVATVSYRHGSFKMNGKDI